MVVGREAGVECRSLERTVRGLAATMPSPLAERGECEMVARAIALAKLRPRPLPSRAALLPPPPRRLRLGRTSSESL